MNRKAQMGLGSIMLIFITAIVGVVLLIAVAQSVGDSSNTVPASNITYTMAANGQRIDLAGQELLGTPIVTNASDGATPSTIGAGNYTIDEVVSATTGVKTISMQTDDAEYAGTSVNVSVAYGADGYIDSSGGRAMAGLIVIMFALAIAVVTLSPTLRSDLLSKIGR